jgi:hypothetical protein
MNKLNIWVFILKIQEETLLRLLQTIKFHKVLLVKTNYSGFVGEQRIQAFEELDLIFNCITTCFTNVDDKHY